MDICVVFCKIMTKGKNQDNQDIEVRIKYRENKKNPGGGEIFHTRPDGPWNPPSLLYNAC
jgi:hypothetical protein